MIIIIEGSDLSGKSTAIDKIAKFYNKGFTLKNNFKPRNKQSSEQIYKHYWDIINLIMIEDFVILDRFFPSQAVYSYMRGSDELICEDVMSLDLFAKVEKWVYIYLDTDLAELKRRYKKRGDEHIFLADLKKIKERYDQFYENTKMLKYKLDTRKENWLEELQKFLRRAER